MSSLLPQNGEVMNCSTCKYSFEFENNQQWNENFQEAYEQEIVHNQSIIEDTTTKTAWKPSPRFFWHDIKLAYDIEEDKKLNYITCKCMPTYAQRKKTDSCGQWSE